MHIRSVAGSIRRAPMAGISLVELLVFIVVVGVAAAGVLSVMNLTTRASSDPMVQKQMLAIAEAMLEEVRLKDLPKNPASTFTGPCTPANRPSCDAVDDYDGFQMGPGILDLEGNSIPTLASYSVSVSVTSTAMNGVPATDARQIVVTVTHPQGGSLTLSGWRTAYGS